MSACITSTGTLASRAERRSAFRSIIRVSGCDTSPTTIVVRCGAVARSIVSHSCLCITSDAAS